MEELTVAECERAVKGPGKFAGEARYVPYFWEAFLNGFAEDDDGTLVFYVSDEDIAMFPELAGRETVYLWSDDNGFVCEVSELQPTREVSSSAFELNVYPDTNPDTSYLDGEGFEADKAAYEAGEIEFWHVYASVEVRVRNRSGHVVTKEIRSSGVYSVGLHKRNGFPSRDPYVSCQLYPDECESLKDALANYGIAVCD